MIQHQEIIKICLDCEIIYDQNSNFCPHCGRKLKQRSSKVYANYGKSGITSISYKTPDGITINSKGNATIYMSLHIDISYIADIKLAFGLTTEPKLIYDHSEHYKCFQDYQ